MSGLKTAHNNMLQEVGQAAVIVADSGSDVVLTAASNRFQVVTPTANRIFTLPSTGIKAGDTFTVVCNSSSYKITLNASGGAAIMDIIGGKLSATALQDVPTLPAHWRITAGADPVKGRTDGQAVPSGYVGYSTVTNPAPFTGSTTRAQIASLTLTPGTWLMSAVFCNARTNAAVGGTYLAIAISTTAGNSIAGCVDGYDLVSSGFNAASGFGSAVIPSKIVNISANTTYYLNGVTDHTASNDMVCSMSVVRIA